MDKQAIQPGMKAIGDLFHKQEAHGTNVSDRSGKLVDVDQYTQNKSKLTSNSWKQSG